jgi:hypothetical protein
LKNKTEINDYIKTKAKVSPLENKTNKRESSDEHYVIDLFDKVLGQEGLRQYRFDFLLGDSGKNEKQTRLPVDVYYPTLNMVVEYKEYQHSNEVKFFDKPDKITVSGVSRGEQRKIYDKRRLEVLPQHGIKLIEISYTIFECDRKNKIVRNPEMDLKSIIKYMK